MKANKKDKTDCALLSPENKISIMHNRPKFSKGLGQSLRSAVPGTTRQIEHKRIETKAENRSFFNHVEGDVHKLEPKIYRSRIARGNALLDLPPKRHKPEPHQTDDSNPCQQIAAAQAGVK